MNEIFIILNDKYSFVDLIFENYKNEFTFHDKIYNFEFLHKNKLKIYDNSESYILDTLDSFIFTNYLSNLLIFKLITLNHNEWFDQALLNNKTNEIIRIKDRNQYGKFEIKEDILTIDWNHWGKENFELYDENIYNHESLERYDLKKDILVFMHMCNLKNGYEIFEKQIKKLKKSKIYENIKKIYVCWLGQFDDEKIKNIENNKIEVIKLDENINYYEFLTINKIKEIVSKEEKEYKVLYIHNKGTRNAGNEKVTESWRNMMEYFLIEEGLYCYINLDYFDTIGCNVTNQGTNELSNVNKNHFYHYSGNFWWSKSSYIKELDYLEIDQNKNMESKRYRCENWILSKLENKKIGIMNQDNTNIHPYHRYVFENYKNKKLYIKKLKLI